jgi:hypothetical protein
MKLLRNDPYIEGNPPHPPYLRGDRETGMTEEGAGTMDYGKCYKMLQNVTNVTWVLLIYQALAWGTPPLPFVTWSV